jgi:SEC-C motif-containing protein
MKRDYQHAVSLLVYSAAISLFRSRVLTTYMANKKCDIQESVCPCGSAAGYVLCCGRYLVGDEVPQSAEQLMRSRYCGFVICDEAYLLSTWHPDTRPGKVRLDDQQRWLGLSVRATEAGGIDDETGTVEYVARFKIDGKGHRLHEISRFEKIEGRWYYLDGQHL